jgi:hypothetical protein
MDLTWAQAFSWRMHRHYLHTAARDDLVAIARQLCGVHAQVMSCAEMAMSIRGTGIAPTDVRKALERERTLVKTWAMRGTLHLLPADDLPLYTAAATVRAGDMTAAWVRYGVDMPTILAAIPEALDGRALTRDALAREVARISGRPELEAALLGSWGGALKPAAYCGHLCFGPNEGRNVTFVSPRQWLGAWREVDTETALAEVLRRYLDAYGPATHKEFAYWFGIQARRARELFARMASELVAVDVEGERAWLTRSGAQELAAAVSSERVRLLPGFDPYVVGALSHLDRLLPGPVRSRVSRTSGWISPVLLADGRIAGTWRSAIKRGVAQLTIAPFAPLSTSLRAAAEREADIIGTLLGAPTEIEWQAP